MCNKVCMVSKFNSAMVGSGLIGGIVLFLLAATGYCKI